jgi:hypothetical protein
MNWDEVVAELRVELEARMPQGFYDQLIEEQKSPLELAELLADWMQDQELIQ